MRRYWFACLVLLALGQAFADDEPLDFATWNLEWFNSRSRGFPENTRGGPTYPARDDYALAATASIVRKHGLDLVGLQEIQSAEDLDTLLRHLPGFVGHVVEESAVQHCAVIWDPTRCTVTVRPGLAALAVSSGQRQGLHLSVVAGKFDFEVLIVHLANDDGQVAEQVSLLQQWLRSGPGDEDVVIAGDFNLTTRERPMRALLADEGLCWGFFGLEELPLTRPPWPGGSGFGKTIDHIFMSPTCFEHERWGPASVPREDEAFGGWYRQLVSDHLPVIQAFHTAFDND